MTLPELLRELEYRGVDLRVRGDSRLILSGAVSILPEAVLARVGELKPAILDLVAAGHEADAEPRSAAEGALYLASYGQSRLAFLDQLDPGSTAYNVTASVILRGPCDTAHLSRALCAVAAAHPALRTRLARIDGVDISVVGLNATLALSVYDLSDMPAMRRSQALIALKEEVARSRFEIERAPLVAWALARLDPGHHELVVALHHYIGDGWSLVRALREAANVARGARDPDSAPCTGVGSYPDYARRQRVVCRTPEAAAALAAWRARLDGFDRPFPFPCDRAALAASGVHAGGRHTFAPDPDLEQRLRARAAALRCTLGTLLTGIFALTLARTSGAERFLIGMAASDRPGKIFEETFGFFVNWLPLRIDLAHHPSIAAFISDLHRERLSALDDTHLPFDRIVSAAGCERRADRHPLFQFMFVSHVPARGVRTGNLGVSIEPLFGGAVKLDLTMFFTDARDAVAVEAGASGIYLEIEYARALFDAQTITRFSEMFLAIAETAAANPTAPAIPEPASHRRCAVARGVRIDHDPSPLFAIARAIGRAPNAVAARARHEPGGTRTFGEIGAEAAGVVEALARAGIGDGHRVCALHARGTRAIAAMLGTMLSGAVYVPLDPAHPDARLATILGLSRPAAILACPRSCARAERLAGGLPVLIPAPSTDGAATLWERRLSRIAGSNPAYLLFTSGSTGWPKGVLGAHGPLANFCGWLARYLDLSAADVVPCKMSPAFDASFREGMGALVGGARLALLSDEDAADTAKLIAALQRDGATVLHGTPTLYRDFFAVLEEMRPGGHFPELLPALRAVMLGGETLDAALAAAHARLMPNCALHNVYGPTECTIDVTAYEVGQVTDEPEIPIGGPIQNVTISVLGTDRRPLPLGDEGEIAIAGGALGLGYWPAPDKGETARFAAAREIGLEGEGPVFLTGDYGILRPDGTLLFRGRRDRQVQVGGVRIELDEIEAALLGLDDVAQAAVLHRAGPGGAHVVAFIERRPGCAPRGPQGWRVALARRLPAAMVPATIEERERLPRLASGKIDRGALASAPAAEPTAAVLEREARLVLDLMRELLSAKRVSPTTSFFAQGGHSLNAVRLVARANRALGRSLTIKEFFADPTAIGFGRRLAQAPVEAGASSTASPVRALRPRRPLHG
jgi:amino acid adenylation domain-containing protein